MTAQVWLKVAHSGTCWHCGQVKPAGSRALYFRDERGLICEACAVAMFGEDELRNACVGYGVLERGQLTLFAGVQQ